MDPRDRSANDDRSPPTVRTTPIGPGRILADSRRYLKDLCDARTPTMSGLEQPGSLTGLLRSGEVSEPTSDPGWTGVRLDDSRVPAPRKGC